MSFGFIITSVSISLCINKNDPVTKRSRCNMTAITAGLDLGNGYVKANIISLIRVFPSIAVKQFNTAHHTPLASDEVGAFMKDIINQMDVSFSSPLVGSTERRLFGERALKSGLNLEEFDVFARIGKSQKTCIFCCKLNNWKYADVVF